MIVLGPRIAPFRKAETAPPSGTVAFFAWAVKGAWAGMIWATFWSCLAGSLEAISATILGDLVDAASTAHPAEFLTTHGALVAWFLGFYLVARPVVLGLNTYGLSLIIEPNLFPLILSRLHRWTLGHSVTFFDNDFAGRIAQKQMQTARAATDVVSGSIETIAFSLASVVGSVALMLAINGAVSVALMVWVVAYILFIRHFLRRVRGASMMRASARAHVTGQIVDTVTNMKTVKLFAHAEHEDRVALDAMGSFRDSALKYGAISSWFRFNLMALAGVLPVLLVGMTIWLWMQGGATAGDIAAAGAISFRLSQMTGWVSFSLMTIFGNLGEVEDGIRTLTPPHSLVDAPGAVDMPRVKGEIVMDHVSFAYGRRKGGLQEVS